LPARAIQWSWRTFNCGLHFLAPLADLIARIWVAHHFYYSALTKFQSWQSTLYLFRNEYIVPLLPPVWAAYIGAYVELITPFILVIGLGNRLSAFILFVFNAVALYSYPFLWTESGASGFNDHIAWGMVLMLLMCYGMGRLSLDTVIKWLWQRFYSRSKQ
jgi:putative oxidoreductase